MSPIMIVATADVATSASTLGLEGLWTPSTPTPADSEFGAWSSPESRDMNSASLSSTRLSSPETPTRDKPLPDLPSDELPASHLALTQRVVQTELLSPFHSRGPSHREDADDCFVNRVPPLFSSDPSDRDTMDALRRQLTPLRKQDRFGQAMMPTYTIGQRAARESQISKPFTAMTTDELLNLLPDCDSATISEQWIPALRTQFRKLIALLIEASELKLDSILNQNNLTKVRGLPNAT